MEIAPLASPHPPKLYTSPSSQSVAHLVVVHSITIHICLHFPKAGLHILPELKFYFSSLTTPFFQALIPCLGCPPLAGWVDRRVLCDRPVGVVWLAGWLAGWGGAGLSGQRSGPLPSRTPCSLRDSLQPLSPVYRGSPDCWLRTFKATSYTPSVKYAFIGTLCFCKT